MGYLTERLAPLTGFLRRGWGILLDVDAEREWESIAAERTPVALPERPTAAGYPDHLLTGAGERELLSTAREMEEDDDWYSALELYLELIRRAEKAADGTLDVTLFNRIGDLHRRLAAEWYLEGVDRYAERDLRRGAVALCEKALHLDPNHPHGLRRRAWLERTGDRREGSSADRRRGATADRGEESAAVRKADDGEREAGDAREEELGAEPPARGEPEGAAGPETARPAEEPSDRPERGLPDAPERRRPADRLGEVYVPASISDGNPDREPEADAPVGDGAPSVVPPKPTVTPPTGTEAPVGDRPEERVVDSRDPEAERLPQHVLVPPPDSAFEGRRLGFRIFVVMGVLIVAAAIAIVVAA